MTTPFTFVLSFAAQLVRPFRSARLGSRPRSPLSWRTARSQLSLRCSTHNAQNSAAGEGRVSQREGRVSQREEGCTLPVTDGFGSSASPYRSSYKEAYRQQSCSYHEH